MEDLCQKWKVKLIFRGAWNSLMAWPDWPRPPPYFMTDLCHCINIFVFISYLCSVCFAMILEWFNRISVYNKAVLFDAIESRRNNQALVTVSNHRSCIDDPVLFGNYQTSEGWWDAWQPPQGNQELLVVKDKVGRLPRWAWGKQVHGMWYFPFNALTLLVGWQEWHPACKKLGVGLLVVMIWLELCTTCSSSCYHHFLHPLLQ